MPLFSVCHEAAAMGCNVNWGGPLAMPDSGPPIFKEESDIRIPADLLKRPGCATPLAAISDFEEAIGRRRSGVRQSVWWLDAGLSLLRRGELPHRHARQSG